MNIKEFKIDNVAQTKYLFFTGKGGVGKTSLACATAIGMADRGERVLLISTDPASNLQDVFEQELSCEATPVEQVTNLRVVNLDPEQAAAEYRESVIAPYRGVLPDSVVRQMEEQLSGSCTIEIAAFNLFSDFITDPKIRQEYDHIIFDTAPTGHTLRMLQLPSAWSTFIDQSTHGASCLGQLAGLEERKEIYRAAVRTLADGGETLLVLVARADQAPLKEAQRSSQELCALGITNQMLILNGVLAGAIDGETIATEGVMGELMRKQREALSTMPESLTAYPTHHVPLRSYNLSTVGAIRRMLSEDSLDEALHFEPLKGEKCLDDLVEDLHKSGKKVIFTMGKGGVGKTTMATQIALKLNALGSRVHLTTTDPANHINAQLVQMHGVEVSRIDEQVELERYKDEVRQKAHQSGMTAEDMEYIEEDLRSPCTQEIAVFKAFAQIVERAEHEVVVIDTAPTGHTLLLLDATQSYHHEVERTQGEVTGAVAALLPRLRDANQTEVVIVTLAEATPLFEAERLQSDLRRAGICNKWWIVNSSLALREVEDRFLKAKAQSELPWIERVRELSGGNLAIEEWHSK